MCNGNVVLSDLCQVYNNYGKIKKIIFQKGSVYHYHTFD